MSPSVLRGVAVADRAVAMPARPPAPPPPRADDDPRALVEGARAEAASIVAAAREEAGGVLEAAREEGYRAGRELAQVEVASALAAVREAHADLVGYRAMLDEEAAGEAALLAVQVAAKLLRAELSIAPERVVDVVRGAIRRAGDRRELMVLVHPDDLAACRAAGADIMESMGGIAGLQFVDEPRVDRGSCIVQGPGGDVDATFASQLGRVLEALAAPPDAGLAGDADPGAPAA